MKNLTLASILVIILNCPAFADNEPTVDIAADAFGVSCDSGVLQTASGSSTLEADWSANTVTVKFYNGDSLYDSQTCTYDGALNLPSIDPTKTGYTFAGWKVKAIPQCSLSGLDPTIMTTDDAEHIRWKNSLDDTLYTNTTMEDNYGTENSSDLEGGEWIVTQDYGIIKGVSTCTTNGETFGETLPGDSLEPNQYSSADTNGEGERFCWCKVTEFTPITNNVVGKTCLHQSGSWVFVQNMFDNPVICAGMCSFMCAKMVGVSNNEKGVQLRQKLFGINE